MGLLLVTPFFVSCNALILVVLAVRVVTIRRRERIGLGTGDSKELLVAVRCHGNCAEWFAPGMLLLVVAELCRAPSVGLYVLGGIFSVGRLLHPLALTLSRPRGLRTLAMGLTFTSVITTAVWLAYLAATR